MANKLQRLLPIAEDVNYLEVLNNKYPKTIQRIGLDANDLRTLFSNRLSQMSDLDFDKLVRYTNLRQKLGKTIFPRYRI